MLLKKGTIPPDGFHYYQDGVRLTGNNEKELITLMQSHRMMFGRPRVNEAECIEDYYKYVCDEHPHFCYPEVGEAQPILVHRKLTKPRLLDRVSYWISYLWRQGDKTIVPIEEAQRRSRICDKCKECRVWDNCHTCGNLIAEVKRILNMVRQGQNLDVIKNKGCNVHGFDCESAVFLKTGFTKLSDAPKECWVNEV